MFWTQLMIRTGLARFFPRAWRLGREGQSFLHYYSPRVLAAPYTDLKMAAGFLEAADEPDQIDLTVGAPQFDLVPSASTKLPAGLRGYPPAKGLPELRGRIAEIFEARQQLHFNPEDEVLVTHGVAGAFSTALDSFVRRADRVVLFDPCSPLYWFFLRARQARIAWVPAQVEAGCLRFRQDVLARALAGARLLVLNIPHNPSGACLAPEDIQEIAWWAKRHDVLIFSDQAFDRYQYERQPLDIAGLAETRDRILIAGSVSKGYALAAARVGWLAGSKHLVGPCALTAVLHTPFVPTLCQQIALAALNLPEETFAPRHAEFDSRRHYAFERMRAMGLEPVWPAGGFFFWVPVGERGHTGQSFAEQFHRNHKVLVLPGGLFGPSGRDFIRISFAGEEGRLREGLGRMGEFLRGGENSTKVAA